MNAQNKPAGRLPEVATDSFEFSHGRRPGSYGAWAFGTKFNTPIESVRFFHGRYGEAKKAARESFRGASIIYVQP